jgi:hypothetical protein
MKLRSRIAASSDMEKAGEALAGRNMKNMHDE